MKSILHLVIAALLTASAVAGEPAISVRTQFCEVPAAAKLPKDIVHIAEIPGADNVVVPETKTASGQPASVSVSRNLELPGRGTIPTGLFLTVRPTLVGGRFDYSVDFERTEFVSFATRSATNAPILNTEKIVGMDGQSGDGERVWLDLGVRETKQKIRETGKRDRTQTIRRRLIAVLTFTKV